ncbi:unnamed protein product [Ostreobium quekettii]|uniref:Uncharacterized protein n=1 Tax=Ostreobium quekettii TaxID=121088 RepID=A0A8S1JDF4_9CHLO|nr:unnamed protein product [Ostreobium quekettii]
MCQGREYVIDMDETVGRTLSPGEVDYYDLPLNTMNVGDWARGIYVKFALMAPENAPTGHACLVAKANGYPTLVDHDHRFTTSQAFAGSTLFRVNGDDIRPGVLVFAVFNVDYFKHSDIRYSIRISSQGGSFSISPYISIALGITVSLFLCVLVSLCKRFLLRTSLWPWTQRVLPGSASNQEALPPRPQSRGLPREIVESFPCHEFVPNEHAKRHKNDSEILSGDQDSLSNTEDIKLETAPNENMEDGEKAKSEANWSAERLVL